MYSLLFVRSTDCAIPHGLQPTQCAAYFLLILRKVNRLCNLTWSPFLESDQDLMHFWHTQ